MDREFCRLAILGSLVRGYFHNLKGSLQGISLPIQRIQLKPDKYLTPEGLSIFEKMLSSVQKLNAQLDVALQDILNDSFGPWDLTETMKKEIIFWEANLDFKHKIKKEIVERDKVSVSLPYNILLGILCLLEAELYNALSEGSVLRIIISQADQPCLEFTWEGELKVDLSERVKKMAKLVEPYVKLTVQDKFLKLCFMS